MDDPSKSRDRASPTELEDTKNEEQAPDTQPAPPGDKDKSDMHSNMEEVTHTVHNRNTQCCPQFFIVEPGDKNKKYMPNCTSYSDTLSVYTKMFILLSSFMFMFAESRG